jgi:hypothetical protein
MPQTSSCCAAVAEVGILLYSSLPLPSCQPQPCLCVPDKPVWTLVACICILSAERGAVVTMVEVITSLAVHSWTLPSFET